MKLIAHRFNSREAIQYALDMNYQGVEFDVQPCASGKICLQHDFYLGDAFIKDMTEEELREKGVCFLEDVYDMLKNLEVYMDIKAGPEEVAKFFENIPHNNFTFCSFNRVFLEQLLPDMKKGTTFQMVPNGVDEYKFLTRGVNSVLIHWTCLDKKFIKYCKQNWIEVLVYSPKNIMEFKHVINFDVDGLITIGID